MSDRWHIRQFLKKILVFDGTAADFEYFDHEIVFAQHFTQCCERFFVKACPWLSKWKIQPIKNMFLPTNTSKSEVWFCPDFGMDLIFGISPKLSFALIYWFFVCKMCFYSIIFSFQKNVVFLMIMKIPDTSFASTVTLHQKAV